MELTNSTGNFVFDGKEVEGKGKHFTSRFIESGAVSYGDAGVLKVTKEALDKFIQSLVGCPVIVKHHRVNNENVDDLRAGVVSDVSFNADDGWFYCSGVIWDKDALQKIEDGWTVSCCYNMTDSTGESGEWHNMHYDDELLNGVFEHLAIVPNPRYEDATIILNSKEGKSNMLLKMFNGKKSNEETSEMDKNALKNKLLEHINKAVKGKGDIDGQSEDAWYKELNEMLDKLSYSESETEKSNKKDEDEEKSEKEEVEVKEEEKENKKCENEDDKEEDEEEEKDLKKNSKFDELKRLHNSCDNAPKTDYVNESTRIELGNILF